MPQPIVADLAELFSETVVVEAYTGQAQHGVDTYASGVSRACHIEGRSRVIRDLSGQERVSTVTVTLAGAFGTSEKDRITLPSRFAVTQPPILAVKRMTDENGEALGHHETVFL